MAEPYLEKRIQEAVADDCVGTPTDTLCHRLKKTPQDLGDSLERLKSSGRLFGFAGLWMHPGRFQEGAEKFMASLNEFHAAQPNEVAATPQRIALTAGLSWQGKPLDRMVAQLEHEGRVVVTREGVRSAEFRPLLTPRQRELLGRVVELLEEQAINTERPRDIARRLGLPAQAVEEILLVGVDAGEVIQAADDIFYSTKQFEAIKELIRGSGFKDGFTPSDMRQVLGTSRRYIVPLLEYADKVGLTERDGDERRLV